MVQIVFVHDKIGHRIHDATIGKRGTLELITRVRPERTKMSFFPTIGLFSGDESLLPACQTTKRCSSGFGDMQDDVLFLDSLDALPGLLGEPLIVIAPKTIRMMYTQSSSSLIDLGRRLFLQVRQIDQIMTGQ
eukprot:scaffold37050_cov199-Amphora_coffeaeformis.AAC.6